MPDSRLIITNVDVVHQREIILPPRHNYYFYETQTIVELHDLVMTTME